jgi:hypothetical protein
MVDIVLLAASFTLDFANHRTENLREWDHKPNILRVTKQSGLDLEKQPRFPARFLAGDELLGSRPVASFASFRTKDRSGLRPLWEGRIACCSMAAYSSSPLTLCSSSGLVLDRNSLPGLGM